ncbi:MAG: twin-arginine translocation pathway signal [Verrucomicrobiaceae bacterium]|nr:twin-arginine translocation pathway signal [Verrucomicrobiaceae bacterium]
MLRRISRRFSLRIFSSLALLGILPRKSALAQEKGEAEDSSGGERLDRWDRTRDRVFLGGDFWANPMEDWRLRDGWAECLVRSGKRSIHSLVRGLENVEGDFTLSVRLARPAGLTGKDGAGFQIGVRSDIDEVRSNCFAHNGITAGITGGHLVLGRERRALAAPFAEGECLLVLAGKAGAGERYDLTLTARTPAGDSLGVVKLAARKEFVRGNIALISQFQRPPRGREEGASWRFTDWRAGGEALVSRPEARFGPILWTMYSLSDSRGEEGFVMKLSALTGPLGAGDGEKVELFVEREGAWHSLGEAALDTDAWLATFRIPRWDEKTATTYKVVHRERLRDGSEVVDEWSGRIKANPDGRRLRIGALTCQNDYAFPYEPVAENLRKLDPDLLYFSGDQLYENHGGFGVIRAPADPAILNYLRKFYQHGWAFREVMRNAPTLCLPDDHDVFQGNYWGEGGKAMEVTEGDRGASSKGGYIQPVKMVNVVHRTNTSHHPDIHDPTAIEQGMSVYYGEVVYGSVGFAIVGDRQWKSGPERVEADGPRADHIVGKDFDTTSLDREGLVLLGERQEKFLEAWADDWRGHGMKVLLSQTLFANVATHHGKYDGYLKADLDSGGWPQTARNRAVSILRKSGALHINGDQHLTTLVQYGVDEQRDSNWSFCTPAIAVGYPRWWRPDELGMPHENRPGHGLADTGEYLDGLGNRVYVHAVGNPIVPVSKHRYEKAHEKGSGFGVVTIDLEAKTYHLEAFRFLVDATDGKAESQFPGWPLTIHQDENRGQNRIGVGEA